MTRNIYRSELLSNSASFRPSPLHLALLTVLIAKCHLSFATAGTYDLPLPVLPAKCPNNFILLPNSNHCYGFQIGAPDENLQTWKEANSSCARDGGTLSHIPQQASASTMFIFLRQKASQMGIPSAWVARAPLVQLREGQAVPLNVAHPHICTYVEFPPNSSDVKVSSVGCNNEKRNFICDLRIFWKPAPMPLYTRLKKKRKRNSKAVVQQYDYGRHTLDAKADQNNKQPVQNNARSNGGQQKGGHKKHHKEYVKPPSTKEVNMFMPDNLSGLAKIPPVRATELVRARSDKIVELYGSPIIADYMLEAGFLPSELETANISRTGLETARAMLLEISADAIAQKHKGNVTEMAKALTSHLLEEGRPIQCHYGINKQQRIVACLAKDSKIESCAKLVVRDGQVIRSCGLPGMKLPGCHHTIDGAVCYCTKDECNSARSINQDMAFISLLVAVMFQLFFLL